MTDDLVKVDLTRYGIELNEDLLEKGEELLLDLFSSVGNDDSTGWIDLPYQMLRTPEGKSLLDKIKTESNRLLAECEYIVCVGIGGSYLGAKAVISALCKSSTGIPDKDLMSRVIFAGHNLSTNYLQNLIDFLKDKDFGLVFISKSGTTIEPTIAYRLLREIIIETKGKKVAQQRILAITDPFGGALYDMAQENGYHMLPIPTNVGGRFSVHSSAGLFPIALAGLDIDKFLKGACDMYYKFYDDLKKREIPSSLKYAIARFQSYQENSKKIEILSVFEPELNFVQAWWQQLFAESEGKENKSLYPATATFSQDLHSIGQWIQEGTTSFIETFLIITKNKEKSLHASNQPIGDKLDFLLTKTVAEVNHAVQEGTREAHHKGGIPIISIEIEELNEYYIGALLYFFEVAVTISSRLLGVNPFDQPGVEAYKKYMSIHLSKGTSDVPK